VNFLAHIYLSGDDEGIILGNFMADSIKGKKYLKYPLGIQKGILLHRAIDSYTDAHPLVRKSTRRLRKNYRHYSGVIVDILYDHFLAKNWNHYHERHLEDFVNDFYALLRTNYEILPTRVKRMMPYMIADNWLVSYASIEGISTILSQMNVRTMNKSRMNFAVIELEEYYSEFEEEFTNFFADLIAYSKNKLKEL
jgi:acyl carrier protein phosphodiesterase